MSISSVPIADQDQRGKLYVPPLQRRYGKGVPVTAAKYILECGYVPSFTEAKEKIVVE